MLKKFKLFGAILTALSCLILLATTLGIRGDHGGSGWYFVFFIVLLVPAGINIYSVLKKDRKIKLISSYLGAIIIIASLITIYMVDKPIHTELYDVFLNMKTIYFGYIVYVIGDILSYIGL